MFPQIILSDISNVDFQSLENVGVDIVVGGPPCQDFSVLRSSTTERSGIMVRRGRLYGHFVRALVQLQPMAFIFENVPGLVTANDGIAYETILNDFQKLDVRWDEIKKTIKQNNSCKKIQKYNIIFNKVVNASHLGVPQIRKRLIIVGLREDLIKKQDPLTLSYKFERKLWESRIFRKYPLTAMEVFEGEAIPNLQGKYEQIMKEYDGIWAEVNTPRAFKWKKETWDNLTFNVVKDYLFMNNVSSSSKDELTTAFREHEALLEELGYFKSKVSELEFSDNSNQPVREKLKIIDSIKMIPPDENYGFVVGSRWELRKKGVSQIYRKIHPLKPSYTVVAYGGGGMAMYHYERTRSALTNREKARLQTFPDAFKFTGSYSNMKAEIGEAVPPLLAKRLAEALVQILDYLA
jgi:DNA (cytosine-5)-methyltransferase 1